MVSVLSILYIAGLIAIRSGPQEASQQALEQDLEAPGKNLKAAIAPK